MYVASGYPRFILTEEILDEKAKLKKARADAKAAGRKFTATTGTNPLRLFENAVKACALKDISLRWLDAMELRSGGGAAGAKKRYFYRPVAAFKSGHLGGKGA